MEAYIVDWLNLLVRWLHLITGIAWIGASFYFVMLDNSLSPPKKPEDAKRGVFGELWAVHGGGFYNSQKYLTGPKGEPLSENLHWSKWEAYTTWLSGMGLLALIYWYGASSYLIDRSVMALTPRRRRRHQHRVHRRRLARLRLRCAGCSRGNENAARGRDAGAGDGRRVGAVPCLRRARGVRPRRRDDRHDDGRERVLPHHSGAEADGRRHPRRPRARPDAGDHRQAALGAQHLLHAAGAVRDDQQPLSDDVQPSATAGSCSA